MHINAIFCFLLFNLSLVALKPVEKRAKPSTCQACHPVDEEKINIHLIPHSHDDVGWLKTVDQYYYGTKKHIQYAGVQYIISSSIQSLLGHPDRRFVQVETAFFWKWWQNQDAELKELVRELVNNGQLEMTNGAWSMNDEAASHYHSIIDQFTWGLRFLNDSFGECGRPKIGWQIDPFGHSREQASLLAQMGFQGLVLGRIDYRDKQKRIADKNLDFIWQSSANLNNSNIFTTMFPDFYGTLSGFCFDVLCSDGQIVDDEESPDYNLREKVEEFAEAMDKYKTYYQTKQYLVPMGGDFNYQAAEYNFANLDKLIKGFKDHDTYNVFYSTPSCYIKAVNDEVQKKSLKLTKKTDDFFPYAMDIRGFWTGYYTSRPTSKRFERTSNNVLQAAKQLTAFSRIGGKDRESSIDSLREVMGIMQHHDAITGTEKEAVAKDYARLLTKAIKEAEAPIGDITGDLLKKKSGGEIALNLSSCLLANVSVCETSNNNKFIVAVYNPLSRAVNHYIHLPVDGNNYNITGPDGEEEFDIFDSIHEFDYVQEKTKPSSRNLIFAAKNVPPLGIKLYYIEKLDNLADELLEKVTEDSSFGTEENGFTISGTTGLLDSVTIQNQTLKINQEFFYYNGSSGYGDRPSGAYIFKPTTVEPKRAAKELASVTAKRGKLVDEVLQVFDNEIRQIIRVYKSHDDGYIEFDWLVGDLQVSYSEGKEIITRFTVPELVNGGIFYTDSNGREQIERILNTRSDYDYDHTKEPVASNYYPITSKIVIKDEAKNLEVAVLNDRAQGGSSLKDGVLELMVHRRLVRDDGLGVGEALSEKEYGKGLYARGQHYLTFGPITTSPAFERDLAHRKLLAPLIWLADSEDVDLDRMQEMLHFEYEGLTRSLDENVQILTLEPWKDDTYLLRLEHVFEENEDEDLSKPVTVDLENLFTNFDISEIGETTLAANQWLDDYEEEEKFIWNNEKWEPVRELDRSNPLKIELKPMQIRTFIIKVVKK